jgi:hypothetical protein
VIKKKNNITDNIAQKKALTTAPNAIFLFNPPAVASSVPVSSHGSGLIGISVSGSGMQKNMYLDGLSVRNTYLCPKQQEFFGSLKNKVCLNTLLLLIRCPLSYDGLLS